MSETLDFDRHRSWGRRVSEAIRQIVDEKISEAVADNALADASVARLTAEIRSLNTRLGVVEQALARLVLESRRDRDDGHP